MNINIYSKPNCIYCEMAKKLLLQNGYSAYNEYVIGRDLTREEFLEKFPIARTVPQIVIDGKSVGGYNELYEAIQNNSLGKDLLLG